jgi:hypothetical protein
MPEILPDHCQRIVVRLVANEHHWNFADLLWPNVKSTPKSQTQDEEIDTESPPINLTPGFGGVSVPCLA